MTASELKHLIWSKRPEFADLYFSRSTMKFFGDTMRNYAVVEHGSMYELRRRRAVKHGLKTSTWFDKETLERVHPEHMT